VKKVSKSFPNENLFLCSQNYALVVSTMKNPGELYAVNRPKKQRFQHESLGFSKMDILKMSIFTFSIHFSLEITIFWDIDSSINYSKIWYFE
jgi:hypothetical protein